MIIKVFKNKIFKLSLGFFFLSILLFGRTFMGIFVFNDYRVGEISMGLSFMLSLFLTIYLLKKKNLFPEINLSVLYTYVSILLFFLINLILTNSSLLNTYTFKSSSYIWTFGFFLLGYIFYWHNNYNKKFHYFLVGLLIYLYFYSIYGIPYEYVQTILLYSDKFEPHKGSDIMIIFVSTLFIFNRIVSNKRIGLEVFLFFSVSYLPLILFKSRASFIAILIFIFFEMNYYRSESIKASFKRNTLIFVILLLVFIQSVFLVSGSTFLETSQENFISEVEYGLEYITTYRADPDDEVFRLFYIAEDVLGTRTTRIFSTDNNLNWRLQIWQDVLYDLNTKNSLFSGYGYKDIIPAMERIDRQGLDRLNENVHNFLITLIARGGLITLTQFIILLFTLFSSYKKLYGKYFILPFFVPIFFNTLFDVTMENSHFPLIFYFVLGMMLNKLKFFPKEI